MTGGAGFSRDASNQSRNNRNQLRDIHSKYFKNSTSKNNHSKPIEYPKADPEVLKKIKADTIRSNQIATIKTIILFLIIAAFGLFIFLQLF